jgi:hypothetical protein
MKALLVMVVVCGAILQGCSSISDEGLALLAFKDAIYDDPNAVLSNWNALDEQPCNWSGINCSPSGTSVQALNLPRSSLKGFLAPELGLLASLQTLNLRANNILGAIPRELGRLKNLQNLDLAQNQLTGAIPNEIGNLSSIARIFLEGNNLAGSIPPELGGLEKLEELRLQRNRLQGTIPGDSQSMNMTPKLQGPYNVQGRKSGLCGSRQLKIANFSYNFLVGRIPICLKYLPRSIFEWNCLQDNGTNLHQRPQDQCGFNVVGWNHAPNHTWTGNQEQEASEGRHISKPLWLLPLEIIMGSIVALFFVLAAIMTIFKRRTNAAIIIPWKKLLSGHEQKALITDVGAVNGVPVMSRAELETACEDFSNVIGSSPDSMVYKGIISQGTEIAVTSMRFAREDWTTHLEIYFQRKVADLAKLNHRNIVKLLGYCAENEPFTRMLVFEYASNGTLYEHLHYGEPGQLSWSARMKIILGVAHGLQYMHHELIPPVAIMDLDSNAVYLTEDFSPKLADFEIWKTIFAKNERRSIFRGTATVARDSVESSERDATDIELNLFSFGVLLLEIITGRFPYSKDQGSLLDWAQEYLEVPEVISYLVDPSLRHFRYSDLQTVCEAVRLCIKADHTKRPSMNQIVSVLEVGINPSYETADLKESPLVWAEVTLLS